VDSYLAIAHKILRAARQPLSAREILKLAYAAREVPKDLYGRTQHKTLQARLSEDILLRRERSSFYRTEPGRFFLREFIADDSIAVGYRTPIVARRRQRELPQHQVLALSWSALEQIGSQNSAINAEKVRKLLKWRNYRYVPNMTARSPIDVVVWSFAIVVRDNQVLTYRHGRYREHRDAFLKKRSIGFFAPIVAADLDLFNQTDHGIVVSALRTLYIDLDIPREIIWGSTDTSASLDCFIVAAGSPDHRDLLGVVRFNCPEWFEPLKRRLAINDLRWHNLDIPVNHFEDFDPWSQLVLEHARLVGDRSIINEPQDKNHIPTRSSLSRAAHSGQRPGK
jgi:hypothetical protein